MTDNWQQGFPPTDRTAPGRSSAGSTPVRRLRRSTADRKIAGVAGGLGRAFGVDPIVLRVAFVVLTAVGGIGGLLYLLGWLLVPADGDETSATGALLGRGRSSVPAPITVVLGVLAVVSLFAAISRGLPFLPPIIAIAVVTTVFRRRRRLRGGCSRSAPAHPWSSARDLRYGAHQGGGPNADPTWTDRSAGSPFRQPAFWERSASPTGEGRSANEPRTGPNHGPMAGPSAAPVAGVDLSKPTAAPSMAQSAERSNLVNPADLANPMWPYGPDAVRTDPPAWDPLGVAPFAWDLPDPTPLVGSSPAGVRARSGVLGRLTLGAALLVGGLTAGGGIAGWWTLSWAQVSGLMLAVVALGLLVSALRGRGHLLILPGILLSVSTVALAVTGVTGTSGYGTMDYRPAGVTDLLPSYQGNAGELNLDLSNVVVPEGQTRSVSVVLKAGHARVSIPSDDNVTATCDVQVGRTECLGASTHGMRQQAHRSIVGRGGGTLDLHVSVNTGFAEVNNSG